MKSLSTRHTYKTRFRPPFARLEELDIFFSHLAVLHITGKRKINTSSRTYAIMKTNLNSSRLYRMVFKN